MSDELEKAAREVADAFNVSGPCPEIHEKAKDDLLRQWPELFRAVYKLAEMLDDRWEYNVEEFKVETGERRVVSPLWKDNWVHAQKAAVRLNEIDQVNVDYGGKRSVYFKVVKRRKPEGYVDA